MIVLVCPPREYRLTGGFMYNREIVERIGADRIRYGAPGDDLPDDVDGLVLDSLFFSEPVRARRLIDGTDRPYCMLVHYLPSEDPTVDEDERNRARKGEDDLILQAAGTVVTGSRTRAVLLERYPEMEEERIRVCRPGVRPPDRTGGKGGAPRSGAVSLLTVSNVTPVKGLFPLLRVLADLKDYSWTWTVYGNTEIDGAYTENLRSCRNENNLKDRVSFAGSLSPEDVTEALTGGDLFLFPSLAEGYGMAAAEALAAGLPVVTNDTGEMPYIVENGGEGIIVPMREGRFDEQGWYRVLKEILGNPGRIPVMASAAARKGSQLPGWEETAELFITSIEEWIKKTARRE